MDEILTIELEPEIIAFLEECARQNGRTFDEEVNAILANASGQDDGLGFICSSHLVFASPRA
jgi:hypothetical protein